MTRLTTLTLTAALTATAAMAQQGIPGAYFIEQWDLDGDTKVTPEEAREKRGDVFFMFDQNEDGVFQAEEWAMIADHLASETAAQGQGRANGIGRGPGAHIRAAMAPDFNDADGDGQVTAEEFTISTDKLFALLDRDGDGFLMVDDLRRE